MRQWQRYRELLGPNPERDLADEVRFHLETETEQLIAVGMAPDDARRLAMARFGDVDRFVTECRASDKRRLRRRRRAGLVDVLRQDIRQSVRGLVRRPVFAAAVITVLALGVGANAAVFSVVDHLFLRPPAAVHEPDELTRVFVTRRRENGSDYFQVRFSMPEARIIDAGLGRTFPSTIFFRRDVGVELGPGATRQLSSAWVSPTYFSVLGVRLNAGNDFDVESGRFGVPAGSAVISWGLWQSAFGADPNVVGRMIRVDGNPVAVRGVAPRGFGGIDVDVTDVWLPLAGFPGFERDDRAWYDDWGRIAFRVLARAPAGVPRDQLVARVNAAMRESAVAARLANPTGRPPDTVMSVIPAPLLTARGPEPLSQREMIAAVLAALSLLLLVIAVANAANMLVGRALDRQREMGVRATLGMGRGRLVSQLVVETLLLAGVTTTAAIVAAAWAGGALRRVILPGVDFGTEAIDTRVVALSIVLALGATLVAMFASLGPTLRVELTASLKSGVSDGGGRRSQSRAALVGVQAALSVMLLIGTGLLGRSLYNVRHARLGVDVDRLLAVKAPEGNQLRMPIDEIAAFARTLPGVVSVALASHPPLWDQFEAAHLFSAQADTIGSLGARVGYVAIDAKYLRTVGSGITRGRDFTAGDGAGGPPVMIINGELARRVRGQRDPLGDCLRIDDANGACHTIIGIAEDARRFAVVEEPAPVFYVPRSQSHVHRERGDDPKAAVIRVEGDVAPVLSHLRAVLGDTATSLRNRQAFAVAELVTPQYATWELGARLFAALAALALLLAVLGLTAVLNYAVASRTREIGVRRALGADRREVASVVARDGIRYLAVGVAAGVLIALLTGSQLGALLYDVSPRDPVIIGSAVALLAAGAVIAAIGPTRRALRVDPMQAIRHD